MAIAYKAVTLDWKSGAQTFSNPYGILGYPDDVWALLQLDYTVGTTVTPDPAVELAAKLDAVARSQTTSPRLSASHAHDSAGLFAYVDPVGMDAFRKSHIGSDLGHLIQISYDEGDVIVDRYKPSMSFNMREIQLASCVVLGEAYLDPIPPRIWIFTVDWDYADSAHFPA